MSDFMGIIEHTFGNEREQIERELAGFNSFLVRCEDWLASDDPVDRAFARRMLVAWVQLIAEKYACA